MITKYRGRGYLQVDDRQFTFADGEEMELNLTSDPNFHLPYHYHSQFVWPTHYVGEFLGNFHSTRIPTKTTPVDLQSNKNRAKQKAQRIARKRTRQNR